MSSLSDILTAAKNIVTAINGLGQTYLYVAGNKTYKNISVPTLVSVGQGRIVKVAIIEHGTSEGFICDATVATATSPKVFVIDHVKALWVIEANLPIDNGIVVVPGNGQVVTVSYS